MLRMVEGLDTAETASALTLTEDVVKTRLSRARAMLRERFEGVTALDARTIFTFEAPRCNRMAAAVRARIAGLPSLAKRARY
jgi:RNA polymerase sigma-70 factor (ECF subfamily)